MNTHCAGLVCAKFYWRAAVFRKHANIFPHLWDYTILFFNSFLSFDFNQISYPKALRQPAGQSFGLVVRALNWRIQ